MTATPHIGFIGLGAMGLPMASNLLKAGYALSVWNRSAERAADLAGVRVADRPADLADCDLLLTMLADDPALRSVMGEGGLLAVLQPSHLLVNLATISVDYARELSAAVNARGAAYVAAPVFGRPPAAAAAQLHIVVAGAADACERAAPVLRALGKQLWPVGAAPEQANVVKIAGNFMIASAIETMAEASAFARAHGVEARDFLGVMTQTLFTAPAYVSYATGIAERRYTPAGFKAQLGLKDVELALSAASSARVPMPMAGVIRDALLDALAHGATDQDWSALAEVAARRAGLDD